VSDQDFFFDEDEKPAGKPAQKQGSNPSAKDVPVKGKSASAPSGGIELTWTITALIGVVALLLGVIVGYAIPKNAQEVTAGSPAQQTAPQLSPEQLSSGQLPSGHPDIGPSSATATAAPSTAATGN